MKWGENMNKELLLMPNSSWMDGSGNESDIVLSSRVRLARNLVRIPFPNRADIAQLAAVERKVVELLSDIETVTGKACDFIELDQLTSLERNVLIEKHLISNNHVENPENRALLLSEDTKVSLMVNEEDHLRIQCMVSGFDLVEPFRLATQIDDVIESKLDLAFNEQIGYLTSCPTNLGTGIRASVMMHLPGLVFTRQINKIINASTQLGLAVRGLYGEGTDVIGNIFQISNQLTMGFSEKEIIENLSSAVMEILTHERAARKALYSQSPDSMSDKVWRSFGILKYARSIAASEALGLLSEIRMGIDLGIIQNVPAEVFNELLVSTRPNFLQNKKEHANLSQSEINRERASVIRAVLSSLTNA